MTVIVGRTGTAGVGTQPVVVSDPGGAVAGRTGGAAILSRTPVPLPHSVQCATIGATTSAQIAAVAAAGLTHNVTVAFWDALQPSGAGTALDSTALANLNTVIGLNSANGLKTIIEHALHYPPSWVLSAVEPFKDQAGNVWSGSSGNGDQVRNWMWTSLGRGYVSDFLTKVYNGLTTANRAAVDRIRFGGGVFGELHYPTQAVASPYSYWCFGSSMQTGTGLGTGLTAAPDTAYTPFSGTTTQDNNFIAWYIGGITNWMTWYAGQLTSAGWTCDLMCLHPGYGIRSNQVHTDSGYRQALSCGEDPATVIAAYASNAQIWPWCTWNDGTDGFIPPTVDSDQAAWKKIFAEAYKNNKHTRIWCENTGGETNAQMDAVFHNALISGVSPITGDPIYPSGTTPPAAYPGYVGMMWLNYGDLTAGGTHATLSNYQGLVTHTWPTAYKRGINDSGGEFGTGAIPGTYNTDYHYDSATSVSYLAGRGHKIVRLPFLWERIQHTLGAALDSTELTRIQSYVSNAAAAGLGVILDVHNFARYSISGTTHVIGDGTLTQANFADLWSRLSAAFVGNAGIAGYGLMNEPHDLTGTTGSYTANSTLYNFDASVQSWVEETGSGTVSDQSGVVHDGANALRIVKTVSSGAPTIRTNDAANNTAVISGGQTIAAWVQVASGTAGTWTAHMEMQNSSFSWQAGSDFSLTPGTWTQITYTPSSGIWSGHHGIGVQFTGSGLSGTPSVTVYVDTVSQGTISGTTTAPQVWENAAQAAVTAIRANDTTTPIMVGGYNFSSADTWPTNHPAAFIADPYGNVFYEAHVYFDDNASGAYANSFATETTDANGEGFYSVTARARTRLSHFTDWCATQGVNGFIGEVGWPNGTDATNWNTVGAALYVDMDRAGFWVAYWSTGEWFGTTYALSAYEQVGSALDTANAQAPIIEAHPSLPLPSSSGVVTDTETVSTSATATATAPSTGVSILGNVTSGVRLILEIAWGADLTDLSAASWVWTDVTTDVDAHQGGLDITVGRPDESSLTQPGTLICTLHNTSGKYSVGPQSANYPNVVRGTPVRVRVSLDSGSTWTVKYQGNAVGFTPIWDSTGNYAAVTLTAAGPLRRLNQGTKFSRSTMFLGTMADSSVQAYRPLEDQQNSTSISAAIGGADGVFRAYNLGTNSWVNGGTPGQFASYSNVPSSAPMLTMGKNGSVLLNPTSAVGTTASTTTVIVGNPTTALGNECLFSVYTNGATVKRWDIFYQDDSSSGGATPGTLSLYGTDGITGIPYGSTPPVAVVGVTFGLLGNTDYEIGLALSNSGATTTYDFRVYQIGNGSSALHISGSTGSNTGGSQVTEVALNNFAAANVPFGHVAIRNTVFANGADGAWIDANNNELGTTRLTRLANAATMPVVIKTDTNTETINNVADKLGFQYYDTFTNLLREIEATTLGVLCDGLNNGLTFITRLLRESQQPSMTVDATQNAIVMPFAPVQDDQQTVNDVSVSQRSGSSVIYADSASQNAIGDYQSSYAVNQYLPTVAQLTHSAQWLVHVGIASGTGYRYPTWTFELEKQPSLIASWLTCFPACRLDVTNISSVRSQHPSGTIRNVLEGWHEQISQHRWTVTANTTSYEPWRVITLAAATGTTVDTVGRYESDGSTVTSNVSAGGTSISVTTPSGPLWTQSSVTADDFPLTVAINGYPVTVTAISGSSSPQTFTVSALAHGVTAGNAVTIYQNAVLGV